MNKILGMVFLVGLFVTETSLACSEEDACDKCTKESEYSWNPNNQYVTTSLSRFYSMEGMITAAYSTDNYDTAIKLIAEYLELANVYRCNWNYGNAIHDSNRIMGLISLKKGEIDQAATYLGKAGKSTGSPQLDSFGPELDLANELLKFNKKVEVVSYLSDIKTFWKMDDGRIDHWIKEIEKGNQPELERFSFHMGLWTKIIAGVSFIWPILIAALFLLFLRNKVHKKWTFGAVSIASGYIIMLAIMLVASGILDMLAGDIQQSGDSSKLIIIIISSTIAEYLLPIVAIYLISRRYIQD